MVVHILLDDLAQFSRRAAKMLNLHTTQRETNICGRFYEELPWSSDSDSGVLLLPEDILTNLPVSTSCKNSSSVAQKNVELRQYVNLTIQKAWSHSPTWKETLKDKPAFKEMILEKPELMNELMAQYNAVSPKPYDFKKDPENEFRWHSAVRDHIKRESLEISDSYIDLGSVSLLCKQFCDLVKKSLHSEFYRNSKSIMPERIGHLILREFLENCIPIEEYDSRIKTITARSETTVKQKILLIYASKNGVKKYEEAVDRLQYVYESCNLSVILLQVRKSVDTKSKILELQRIFKREGKAVPAIFPADARGIAAQLKRKGSKYSRRRNSNRGSAATRLSSKSATYGRKNEKYRDLW